MPGPLDLTHPRFRRVVILGGNGQLGSEFWARLAPVKPAIWTREVVDLKKPKAVYEKLEWYHPTLVINAAAYTQVDQAESDHANAQLVNVDSPAMMAKHCVEHQTPLIHFSTDYVFSGSGLNPWREDDETHPLNTYGLTKRDGEREIQKSGAAHLIFRTSWVYDALHENFFTKILRLGRERDELKIVSDQVGAPTYAPHLVEAVLAAANFAFRQTHFPTGIYHAANTGETSWYGFTQAIFKNMKLRGYLLRCKSVKSILSSEYPTPAHRPLNSRLDQSKLKNTFGISLPSWQDGLLQAHDQYLENRK